MTVSLPDKQIYHFNEIVLKAFHFYFYEPVKKTHVTIYESRVRILRLAQNLKERKKGFNIFNQVLRFML